MPLFNSSKGRLPRVQPVSQPPQSTVGSPSALPHTRYGQDLGLDENTRVRGALQALADRALTSNIPEISTQIQSPDFISPFELQRRDDPLRGSAPGSTATLGTGSLEAPKGGFQNSAPPIAVPDIARAAFNAGFRGENLITAVAVGLAESSARPGATGDTSLVNNKWGPSVGIWQVRTLRNPTDQFRNEAFLRSSVQNQAAAAFNISGGGGNFRPWSVFTSGAYKRFLDDARRAVSSLGQLR